VRIAGLILAAGESSRMGRPKALLPWGDTTLVRWQVDQMRQAGVEDVIVVLGHDAPPIAEALRDAPARIVLNEAYREGRASSLRAGARALSDESDVAVVLGVDQPRPARITLRLIETWREEHAPVVLPAVRGRRGHPVLVDRRVFPELREASEEEMGLRGVLDRYKGEIKVLDIDDELVNLDLNTPHDYEAALKAHFGKN
jgi:molybdenum cofactor cytidylyltransferase